MPTAGSTPFAARLRRHLTPLAAPPTDADLLARFVADRDDAAFAELVRRHGPAVLAVCRRVTGNRDDADDAFQVTCLALARFAGRVQPDRPLAAWLYGVAVRAARKAVARTTRRRKREMPVGELPDVPERPSLTPDPDTVRAVLEEVGRLSAGYRAAVVLCELEGRSRAVAAQELGIPEGTLSSRLAAARKILAVRLRHRGLVATALAAVAGSATCPVLAADAVRLARASGLPSPVVEKLMEAVVRQTPVSLWKLISVVGALVTVGLVVTGAEPPVAKPGPLVPMALWPVPKPAAAVPKSLPKGPNKLLVSRSGCLALVDPNGNDERKVVKDREKLPPVVGWLSPDGKQIAYLVWVEVGSQRMKLFVKELGEEGPGTDMGVECRLATWSPDGKELAVTDFDDTTGDETKLAAVHYRVDVASRAKTALKLPENHLVTDWSRDGKYLLTTSIGTADGKPTGGLNLMNPDGSKFKTLTRSPDEVDTGKLSPDGRRVLYDGFSPPKEKSAQARSGLFVLDVATGRSTPVADLPLNGDIGSFCWSPDGTRIAYTWRQVHEGTAEELVDRETESHLVVCDPDGKNQKTIASEKAQGQWVVTICGVDWR